ncbi:exodeoxyribonuclease VII large subunit [Xanthobacteraceae bacterium A53D]
MPDTPQTRANAPEWSVTELSFALRRTVEDAYGHVRVRGEISGYRGPHSSGHAYFSLKDEGARLDAVVWKSAFARLKLKPEEGLEVVAIGKLTTYPGKSGYQIVIEQLEFAGAGAIMAMLEERKQRLALEGLFDPARKAILPFLPKVIGVITSPTGAVIRDILHRLSDRFPRQVLVWPVRVQGETSAAEVAAAIEGFNALPEGGAIPRPDVLIVARGGGSLEDLLGFSDEAVVRAAAASMIPLVSAVGHETDVTLIDFAADVRAPTPTAAAEMVVPVRADLIAGIEGLGARLTIAPLRLMQRRRADFRALARHLPSAETLLAVPRQRLDGASDRLPRALKANAVAHRLRLEAARARLAPSALRHRLERLAERVDLFGGRLEKGLAGGVQRRGERLSVVADRLGRAHAANLRAHQAENARGRERLADLASRAQRAMTGELRASHRRLNAMEQMLRALSYRGVLARGFALVRDADGQAVRAAAGVSPGASLELEFADGRVNVVAGEAMPATAPRPAAPKTSQAPAKGRAKGGGQGSLFDT